MSANVSIEFILSHRLISIQICWNRPVTVHAASQRTPENCQSIWSVQMEANGCKTSAFQRPASARPAPPTPSPTFPSFCDRSHRTRVHVSNVPTSLIPTKSTAMILLPKLFWPRAKFSENYLLKKKMRYALRLLNKHFWTFFRCCFRCLISTHWCLLHTRLFQNLPRVAFTWYRHVLVTWERLYVSSGYDVYGGLLGIGFGNLATSQVARCQCFENWLKIVE